MVQHFIPGPFLQVHTSHPVREQHPLRLIIHARQHQVIFLLIASNACGSASTNSTLAITTTSSLASLGVITGTTSPLLGQTGTPYSVAPITGATTYSWSVPGGATVSSGQGTPSIGVDFSCAAVNGTVVVSASNGCVSTSPVSLSFALSSVALTQPAAITGLTSVPRGTTSVTYSITAVTGATSYIWTAPANCVITSGQGTTTITVDFSSCSAASGNIGVTASNGCVANSPERTLAVTVTTVALPMPGVITGTQTPVFGQNGVTYSHRCSIWCYILYMVLFRNRCQHYFRSGFYCNYSRLRLYCHQRQHQCNSQQWLCGYKPCPDAGNNINKFTGNSRSYYGYSVAYFWTEWRSIFNCASNRSNHIHMDCFTGSNDYIRSGDNIDNWLIFPALLKQTERSAWLPAMHAADPVHHLLYPM